MMLIIFLGLIAKLALVSGDCNVGTQDVKDFDYNKSTGTWYVLMHKSNDVENNVNSVVATYELPEGNVSKVTLEAFIISANSCVTLQGNVTSQDGNAFDESFEQTSIWSGRYYIIAIDYDRYVILKMCSFQSNELYIYVAYRSQHPDKKTVKKVLQELKENNIDESQLVESKVDNCPQAGSSTE